MIHIGDCSIRECRYVSSTVNLNFILGLADIVIAINDNTIIVIIVHEAQHVCHE